MKNPEAIRKHQFKKLLTAAAKPLIAVLMLGILLRSGLLRLEELKSSLTNANILLYAILLLSIQTLFFGFRWKFFVNQVIPFTLPQSVRQTLIGYFFNFFIPGGVGGDVFKALDLAKTKGLKKSTSFSLIFLDRILGLYSMIFFSLIFLFIENVTTSNDLNDFVSITFIMFIITTSGLLFSKYLVNLLGRLNSRVASDSFAHKIFNLLYHFCEKISSSVNLKNITWSLIFSFFAQFFAILFLYKVTAELAPDAAANFAFGLFFPLACFAFMASSIPITPGGIGLGQASFYFIFAQFDKTVASQLVIAISLYQLFCLAVGFLGGFFYLNSNKYVTTAKPLPDN